MIKVANALSFVLEVALVGAVILWGIHVVDLPIVWAVLLCGLPAVIVTTILLSAHSSWRLLWPVRPVVSHALFAAAGVVLIALDFLTLGWGIVTFTAISVVLTIRLRRVLGAADHQVRASRTAARERRAAAKERPRGRRAASK
ncbi:DUF2568 domain-containing protein [Zhihengliuella flava]|uniref:Membrane protein n=1 Tax=Zhihengliuella flava TaxID=1285193 RepID=A0A931GHW9_9MICC|nr:DUF2568 domain-containing protein [Zhihengliuella flava]MBG6083676.1 putative membrane protein [Zhihengliuella flava]